MKKKVPLTHGCKSLVEWVILEYWCHLLQSWLFSVADKMVSSYDITKSIPKYAEV